MKNNYPIQYAVMPIIDQVGSHGLNALERKFGPVAYIVSKCYLVKEEKVYLKSGEPKERYQVVFPYELDDLKNIWVRVEPTYHLFDQKCTNGVFVSNVFDTYEEAEKQAKIQNANLISQQISNLPLDSLFEEKRKKIKNNYIEILEKYQVLQQQIESKTDDLIVGSHPKDQKIIINRNGEIYESGNSLYDFLCCFNNEAFEVYTISKEEYEEVKGRIRNKKILDVNIVQNKNWLLKSYPEKGIIRIAKKDKEGVFYLKNDFLYYDSNEEEQEREISSKVSVYTQETYTDIIQSFIPKFVTASSLSEIKLNQKVFAKRIGI